MPPFSPPTQFLHLANVWRLLSLRYDIDDVVLELLGRFSLDRLYVDGDVHKLQHAVDTLLSRLNAILYIQRLSLPSDQEEIAYFLAFLSDWEIVARLVEFAIEAVVDGGADLWNTYPLLDKQLGSLVLMALRVLSLHPRKSANEDDLRYRYERIHGLIEKLLRDYPRPQTFPLVLCLEMADALRNDPGALALPPRLQDEMPNLAKDMYPLPDCLSDSYVVTIVDSRTGNSDQLAQLLAIMDIAQFVVGASIQYAVAGETRDMFLPVSSAKTRDAVFFALEQLNLPETIVKTDVLAFFSEVFRLVLPESHLRGVPLPPAVFNGMHGSDALKSFCLALSNRQVIHRASDALMIEAINRITEDISVLDDPTGKARGLNPRAYVVNCPSCHISGDTELRLLENLEFPDPNHGSEIGLPADTKCIYCGQSISLAREIPLVRETWTLLSSIEYNADQLHDERHTSSQFQLFPLEKIPETHPPSSEQTQDNHASPISEATTLLASLSPVDSVTPVSPVQTKFDLRNAPSPQESTIPISLNESIATANSRPVKTLTPIEPISKVLKSEKSPTRLKTMSKWTKFGSKKETKPTADDASSTTLSSPVDNLKPEEVCLRNLANPAKQKKKKGAKTINIYLSQNNSYALFWTPLTIQVWDIGPSPAVLLRIVSTGGSCLLATVTKTYLAYIVAQDQKLSLRIINLVISGSPPIEYRIPSSQWCKSIAISPLETYVAVGFPNAVVRFFKLSHNEPPIECHLHHRYHSECKNCPAVDTLSFSACGDVLLATTRNPKTGVVQFFERNSIAFDFRELSNCHHLVPLHESEDNGITAALYRVGMRGNESMVCLTTWTQSGAPMLLKPETGGRVEVKTDSSSQQRRIGNRIQCAAFSHSGSSLGLVNDKGILYLVSNVDSAEMEPHRIATSKELTTKSHSFAMSFTTIGGEETIILTWADAQRELGFVKRVAIPSSDFDSKSIVADASHALVPTGLSGGSGTGSSSTGGYSYSPSDHSTGGPHNPEPRPHYLINQNSVKVVPGEPAELAATDGIISKNQGYD